MKIRSENFEKVITTLPTPVFYRATQSSVDLCRLLLDFNGNVVGFNVGQQFIDLSTHGAVILAFDGMGASYFTVEQEAVGAHRDAVISYIRQLNSSSLRAFPILYGNPTNL